ncbi:MAG: RNA-binding S4 domain-containing protein [Alphaproteobacteria bacterium]|nr:RNA-binding S4 domain-containing protein [Alphaproteobacteria bacterium]
MREKNAISGALTAQRIDKWLWCARLFKTRSQASKAAASGSLRLMRDGATFRVEKASALIRAGDRIAFLQGQKLRVIEIIACAARRGPSGEARMLYTEPAAASLIEVRNPELE